MIEIVLADAWISDRESRGLPGGEAIAKRGASASLVRLSLDDATEMLSDLDYYADFSGEEARAYAFVVRPAKAALPRMKAALLAAGVRHKLLGH